MTRPDPNDYQIVPTSETLIPQVKAFNARLAAAGSRHGFYDMVRPDWLAHQPGATVWRDFYLLVEKKTGLVRGGYGQKHELFSLDGHTVELGWLQGPQAESVIEPALKGIGGMMIRDSLAKHPMQISWGANSLAAKSAGSAPMLLRVRRFSPFARDARLLNERTRRLARLAAATGTSAAVLAWQNGPRLLGPPKRGLAWQEVEQFGDWADEVWAAARAHYRLIAHRDAATLNRLLPRVGYPEAIPLRVDHNGRTIGWAALRDRRLDDDPLLGNLHSGSVIDALALPGYESSVAWAAAAALDARGVDLIGACFLHADWNAGFRRAGFLVVPNRRNIGFSTELVSRAGSLDGLLTGTHLSLIDSDGPRIF